MKIFAGGCGAVGWAVASDTRDLRFESSNGQFYRLLAVLKLYRKDENIENRYRQLPNNNIRPVL